MGTLEYVREVLSRTYVYFSLYCSSHTHTHTNTQLHTHGLTKQTHLHVFIKGSPELGVASYGNNLVELGLICSPLLLSGLVELLSLTSCLLHVHSTILLPRTLGRKGRREGKGGREGEKGRGEGKGGGREGGEGKGGKGRGEGGKKGISSVV